MKLLAKRRFAGILLRLDKIMFTGTYTAIVTPFRGGQLDEAALERLIKFQIKGGVDGIVPVGTTGESPTVNCEEHIRIIDLSVKFAAKKIKVLAGTGANATSEAIALTQAAEKAGADGSLQVAPYYNKPTQEGLYQHFKAIAKSTKLPIVLYSIPGRCGIEIAVDTVKRLANDCKNIVGIKEAGGSCDRVSQLRAALGRKVRDFVGRRFADIAVYVRRRKRRHQRGVQRDSQGSFADGGGFARGDARKAYQFHARYYPLFKDLFIETNPTPVKAALAMMKIIEEEYRLPLVPMNPKNWDLLRTTLKRCDALE